MAVNGECCTLTSRYCDFFLLISKIGDADNLKALSLPDLFLSIDALVRHRRIDTGYSSPFHTISSIHFSQERKYKRAASEDAWLNVKHDILFQV